MTYRDLAPVTHLLPGQSLRVALDAGAALLVLEGSVRVVSPPSWFGETMFSVKNDYEAGEVFQAAQGGWVELSARGAASVQGLPQATATRQSGGSLVARVMRWFTAPAQVRGSC